MGELFEFLTTHEQFRRARLPALYSDFRALQNLNPDGFAANVEAWKKGLASALREGCVPASGDLLVLRVDESLMHALETREWGRPLALGAVLRDAAGKKEMMPLKSFMSAQESIYQRSWSSTPWQAVSWGLRQFGLMDRYGDSDKVSVEELVVLSNVEAATREVLRRMGNHTSRVDMIYSKLMFYRDYGDVLTDKRHISQRDLEVLLTYISRDKGLADYDGQTIKFKSHSDAQPPKITHEDSSIASLKNLMFDIEKQLETLAARIDSLSTTAREAVSRKNRVSAIAALRSKRLAESQLAKQSAVLGQLEEVYSKIGEAADQVELMRIMEGSTGVLKALHKEIGGVERVDDVLAQLGEQMAQVDEVGNVITEMNRGAVDESEVDDELEALELEDRDKKKEAERLSNERKEEDEAAETERRLGALETAVEPHVSQSKQTTAGKATEGQVEENSKLLEQLLL
ncbi:hypothetical protein VE03_08415 [Pseudogymnoascus sp. 23342-1-I1]|nr:hypothetical protein VE03_08415 [Pseudogymnoascus sp. 23342-1-I1]